MISLYLWLFFQKKVKCTFLQKHIKHIHEYTYVTMKKKENDPDYIPYSSDESLSDDDYIYTEDKLS